MTKQDQTIIAKLAIKYQGTPLGKRLAAFVYAEEDKQIEDKLMNAIDSGDDDAIDKDAVKYIVVNQMNKEVTPEKVDEVAKQMEDDGKIKSDGTQWKKASKN